VPNVPRFLLLLISAIFITEFLTACAGMRGGSAVHPYWPKPPERARFIYESSISSELDIVSESNTDLLRATVAGSNPRANRAFLKPYDVAARNGRILVSDSGGNIVNLFDLAQGKLFRIGRGEKGKLQTPSGVTIDNMGNLYVADVKAKRVVMYNGRGHFIRSIGDGELFSKPADVAVSNSGDRIYVVDLGALNNERHRVVVFNPEGEILFTFGIHGNRPGELHLASHIAVGPDNNVYVLDGGNFRVQVFDRDGKYLRHWGKVGANIGDFGRPRGLAIDADGNVYVTDATFGVFQIFNPQGQLLMFVGNTGLDNKPGQYPLAAGIAVDDSNHVFVVDQMYNKVEVLRRLSDIESDNLAKNRPLNFDPNKTPAPLNTQSTSAPPPPETTPTVTPLPKAPESSTPQ